MKDEANDSYNSGQETRMGYLLGKILIENTKKYIWLKIYAQLEGTSIRTFTKKMRWGEYCREEKENE